MVLGFIQNVEDKDPLRRYATNELVGQHLEKGRRFAVLFLSCRDIEVLSYLFQNCCFSDSQSHLVRKEMRVVTYL